MIIDPFELAIFLTNNEEDWEGAIEEKYGIKYAGFCELIDDLIPLITVAEAPLTKTVYKGFADASRSLWLAKTKLESE